MLTTLRITVITAHRMVITGNRPAVTGIMGILGIEIQVTVIQIMATLATGIGVMAVIGNLIIALMMTISIIQG